MNKTDQAKEHFISGLNCCQSVFAVFATEMGIDKDTAFKLCTGFGGGIGRTGHMCGAVTGAIAVLGSKYGNTNPEDGEAKEKMYKIVQEFMGQFKEKHKSVICNDLINHDIYNPEDRKLAAEENVFRTICPQLVVDATQIAEKMLQDSPAT